MYLVPELSGAIGGLCATAAFLAVRWRRVAGLDVPLRALLPYGFLLSLLALANGLGTVRDLLEKLDPIFAGPGLPLLLSGGFAAALLGLRLESAASAVRKTVGQWLPTAGAVLTFVLAGQVVASSGAASVLASAATVFGDLYPAAAPAVGFLGGALTGSNAAASNALFMPLQIEAAKSLGVSESLVAAIQNVAGSHTSMLAPQRAILAATATGLIGQGAIVRAMLPPVISSVVVLALIGAVL